jgi:Ca-activated chloride channel family protein
MRDVYRIIGIYLYLLIGALIMAACGPPPTNPEIPAPTLDPTVTNVSIWTNDTKAEWVHEVTGSFNDAQLQTASGKTIFVNVEQLSSGDVYPLIEAGEIEPTAWSPGTIAWINQANVSWEAEHGKPLTSGECPNLVYTAIGVGMWRPMAEAMGWPNEPIGWSDIIDLAADPEGWARYGNPQWGQFKFGHTHPGWSNTGFLAMTSLVYNTLGITEGLIPELVKSEEVFDAFEGIEANTYHYGASTRSLFTKMATRGPSYLHAGTNSEIGVLATNFYNDLEPPWEFVHVLPADGTFWSENPYCILDAEWVTDEQREAATIYRDYLLGSEAQNTAVAEWLRPVDDSIALVGDLSLEGGVDTRKNPDNVPALESVSGETAQAVEEVFLQTKKPATVVIVFDRSGSMSGGKIEGARDGITGFLTHLQPDDVVQVLPFDDSLERLGPPGRIGDIGPELKQKVMWVKSGASTRLYDAICLAVREVNQNQDLDLQAGENRLYGIVVLSDGKDTASQTNKEAMFSDCLPSGEAAEGVKIFTIAYGDNADEELLEEIAVHTNGRAYTADPDNIEEVYRQISSEQ